MSRAPAAVLSLILIVGLQACGGEEGTQERPEEQIEVLTARFSDAIASEDAKSFCELLAPNDVQKLGGDNAEKRCLVVWGKGQNPLFGVEDPELEIESVTYEGPYATATLTNGGELGFAREGGRWYVHLAPEGGGGP